MTFVLLLALAAAPARVPVTTPSPAAIAAPAAAPAATSKDDATPLNVPQPAGANEPAVDQIAMPAVPASQARSTVSQISSDAKLAANVKDSPEEAIAEPEKPPELALYEDVAKVWHTIRMRGQQPTPELIAREIGPDQLSRFLTQIPDSSQIFGVDSDTLPLAKPGAASQPLGAGIIVLPAQGS